MPERVNHPATRSLTGVGTETDFEQKQCSFHPQQRMFFISVVIPIEKKCTKAALAFFANSLPNRKSSVIISAK
jgi:hypothetical protein